MFTPFNPILFNQFNTSTNSIYSSYLKLTESVYKRTIFLIHDKKSNQI